MRIGDRLKAAIGLPFASVNRPRRAPASLRRRLVRLASWSAVIIWAAAAQADNRVVPRSADQLQLSFAPLVEEAAPAVVNIYTRRVAARRTNPFLDDPFFQRFFGRMFSDMPRRRVENSLGSGVIISADGIIVTNHHVIENSDEIIVALPDRREFEAEIVGADESSDLAVLRIETDDENLPTLELGDSDTVQVGDLVLAIGNPFGVGQTVTSGIISADVRTGLSGGAFIQTDAAINPGNSGGALITLDGRLIGINKAILSRGGGSVGIGFAIPANLVRIVVEGMMARGRIVRPWIGVDVQAVTAELARSLDLERPVGVLVNQIHPSSPLDLRIGDIILAVDGHEVFDPDSFHFRISTRRLGETVRLTVRGNRSGTRNIALRLAAPPEIPRRDTRRLEGNHPLTGVTVANLSPALTTELNLDPLLSGVVVLRVERGPASRLGLRPGDIVAEIAEHDIESTRQLARILRQDRREWQIGVRRGGRILRVMARGR